MQPLQDYHTHTCFSFDGQTQPEELIRKSAEWGITHLAITDHADFAKDKPLRQQLTEFVETFGAARRAVECAGQQTSGLDIEVAFGIEIGQPLFAPAESAELAAALPFDVVLMSVHQILDYPDFYFFDYNEYDPVKTIGEYFEEVVKSVKTADFDVLTHLFYPHRYLWKQGMDLPGDFGADAIDETLKWLAQNGKALEINVSTVYAGYPSMPPLRLIRRFRELGGEFITVGTDDHKLLHQQRLPAHGLCLAAEAGFKYFTTYRDRCPQPVRFIR
ncbi:MAG: PHP domain-containing protein [Clostridia bacterium]|nr:PHP domain-containing protein [Clostridia bacterium]